MKLRFFVFSIISILFVQLSVAITLQEAKALVVAQDYEKALEAFHSLILQPKLAKNPEVNKYYGQCLCMLGRYKESLPYLEIGTKGKISGAWWYLGISRQHLYDFKGAIDALEKYKTLCTAASGWIARTDSIIDECEIGLRAVKHVQDVVIVDSLLVPKQNFFTHYKLGHESGHLLSESIFENIAKDFRLIADSTGLYSRSFFDGQWIEPEKIALNGFEDYYVGYPFQRSDGETLYFASDITPGFGGLDIYMTRFNTETDSYYSPTRLGMPFNSPYDDYMLAIDETNQVGWWATERGAKPGFVCIYIFIFDEEADYLDGENISRARIDCIADTWKEEDYNALLNDIHNASLPVIHEETLFIPIREGLVYTSVNDFKTPEAREAYESWEKQKTELALLKENLNTLRKDYHDASDDSKKNLKAQILQKEAQLLNLQREAKVKEKSFRELEK